MPEDPAVQTLLEAARELVAIEMEAELTPAERELLLASHESKLGYPAELSAKMARLAPRKRAAREALQRAVAVFDEPGFETKP